MRVMAVSPHLDDAVFSAGGQLAEHAIAQDAVCIATCFTANVPQPRGFALACQLDKGLGADIDYMKLRRREDARACAAIGAEAVHLPFLEAPHRGYEDAAALFGTLSPSDDIVARLIPALRRLIADWRPDILYGPHGIGGHVDHVAVRTAIEALRPAGGLVWWEDYPYAMQHEVASAAILRKRLNDQSFGRKLTATLLYESQLGYQFGGREAARAALNGWRFEGFEYGRQP